MDCPTHTHYKWDCPKTNGRHEWERDDKKGIIFNVRDGTIKDDFITQIGLPVKCLYDCGAFGVDWYKYEETIEG